MRLFSYRLRAGVGAALLAVLCTGVTVAQEKGGKVEVGKPAPAFDQPATQIGKVLPDKKEAKTISLKDLEGKKNVVLLLTITP